VIEENYQLPALYWGDMDQKEATIIVSGASGKKRKEDQLSNRSTDDV
jgi:hypothetical protein